MTTRVNALLKHRHFAVRGLTGMLLAAGLVVFCARAPAADLYVAGQHYTELEEPLTVTTGDNIEVMELFWYGCPHCYSLEPFVDQWLEDQPENTELVRVPAVFNKRWEFHARAFYTFEVLNITERVHSALFDAIHKDNENVNDIDELIDFLKEYEVEEDDVRSAFKSFAVDNYVRRAMNVIRKSRASGVPAVLVDGKYLVSISQTVPAHRMFDVVDFLVQKATQAR